MSRSSVCIVHTTIRCARLLYKIVCHNGDIEVGTDSRQVPKYVYIQCLCVCVCMCVRVLRIHMGTVVSYVPESLSLDRATGFMSELMLAVSDISRLRHPL